jgi:hypothetical protein
LRSGFLLQHFTPLRSKRNRPIRWRQRSPSLTMTRHCVRRTHHHQHPTAPLQQSNPLQLVSRAGEVIELGCRLLRRETSQALRLRPIRLSVHAQWNLLRPAGVYPLPEQKRCVPLWPWACLLSCVLLPTPQRCITSARAITSWLVVAKVWSLPTKVQPPPRGASRFPAGARTQLLGGWIRLQGMATDRKARSPKAPRPCLDRHYSGRRPDMTAERIARMPVIKLRMSSTRHYDWPWLRRAGAFLFARGRWDRSLR